MGVFCRAVLSADRSTSMPHLMRTIADTHDRSHGTNRKNDILRYCHFNIDRDKCIKIVL
jgi:hypothetical protein